MFAQSVNHVGLDTSPFPTTRRQRIRWTFQLVVGTPAWGRRGRRPLQITSPSPFPSPSGGGCRPQGRPERENVTEPRCGNDRNRGSMRTILPFASGHVLPLPSSASRGIGGCHLPPLGEGKGGCEFAVGGIKPLPDAAGDVGDAIPYGRVRIRPSLVRVAAGYILTPNGSL